MRTIPRAAIIIIVTFMFHRFFSSLAQSFFIFSLIFSLRSAETAKCIIQQILFFLLIITWSDLLAEITWSVCISKKVSFSGKDSGLCIYHLIVWSNFIFLHNSQWITFANQSFLVLCSFHANLLHLLIMWLIVSSQSPHNLHL